MKRTVFVILAAVVFSLAFGVWVLAQTGDGQATPPSTSGLFTDVPKDNWAYDDIKYLVDRGIITGLPGGKYNGAAARDRYSAAAMIARAIKYVENNPQSVTPKDLDTLKNLIFKVSDNLATLQTTVNNLQGGQSSDLAARVTKNEQAITQLQAQVSSQSSTDVSKLSSRVNANFIIALTALLVGIVGVALATFRL